MMNSLKKHKNILISIVAIVLLFALYNFFFVGDDTDELLVSEGTSDLDTTVSDALVATLLELKSLRLDENIFQSSAFKSLQDFSVDILPQPVGRRNPFAPIGVGDEGLNTEVFGETSPAEGDDFGLDGLDDLESLDDLDGLLF